MRRIRREAGAADRAQLGLPESIARAGRGPGSTVTIPGKLALGMRTPGRSSLTASMRLSRHSARNDPVTWSETNPIGLTDV